MLNAIKDIATSGTMIKDNRRIKHMNQLVLQIQLNNTQKAHGSHQQKLLFRQKAKKRIKTFSY